MDFFQYLINGLSQGAIYALIALGYTMVYGILKFINFAHGEFYMVGAFVGIFVFQALGLPFLLGLPLVMAIMGIVAVLIERVAYRPLRGAKRIAPLITALGISISFAELTRVLVGPEPRGFPQVLQLGYLEFSGVIIRGEQILILGLTIVLMGMLTWIVMRTKLGRAMRALSEDFDACRLMGVNIDLVVAFTFFLGAALAGVAGVMVGLYYNQVEPYMGQLAGLKAFTAAVLGGIGVIPGAVMGAVLLGLAEAMVVGYWASSYRDAIAFAILILVLMFRPWGLLGRPERIKV